MSNGKTNSVQENFGLLPEKGGFPMLKVFLDDERKPSDIHGPGADEEWVVVKTTDEVKLLLLNANVSHLSLDNDLGLDVEEGYKLVYWMIKTNIWPKEHVYIHSANIVRNKLMKEDVQRYFYNKKKK